MATTDDVAAQLAAHEALQKDRYEHTIEKLSDVKSHVKKGEKMETNPLAFMLPLMGNQGSTGAAMGGGLGAGLLGGILGGTLLNRGGLLGGVGDGGAGYVTPAQLTAALNGVTESNNTSAVLQTLGDIKTGVAGIPTSVALAEGQVQLALQGAQADLNRNIDSTGDQVTAQISAAQLNNANNFAATSRQLSDIIATSLASQNAINVNVLNSAAQTREAVNLNGAANMAATKDAATATQLAINTSTSQILAALNAQDMANLQRQLTVAETTLAEQRSAARSREIEVTVSQTVNQTQLQTQAQNQQQQQLILLSQIAAGLGSLQHATAANTQIIAGNRGYTQGGAQSAVPTNVTA